MTIGRPHLSETSITRRLVIAAAAGALVGGALGRRTAMAQTPIASDVAFSERIGALFALAPAMDVGADSLLPFYYADLLTQMEATGVTLPAATAPAEALPDGYAQASLSLPLAAQAFAHGLTPEWFETFGFSSLSVHRTISLDAYPRTIAIFQGGLDPASVEAALEASGYRQVDQETGGAYWTVGDELTVDSAVGRLGVGAMNSAALFGDTVVFTFLEATIQTVTQTAAGLAPSMLEGGLWPALVALFPEDTVALVPVGPQGLGAAPDTVEVMAFGVRAGAISAPLDLAGEGTPIAATPVGASGVAATVDVRIRYVDADLAAGEAAAIPDRWRGGQSLMTAEPLENLMTLESADIHPDDPRVVAVTFISAVPNRYLQMIHTRDLQALLPVMG